MSCHLTKPSDAALQAALHTFRQVGHPPPLVPHPPEKTMAWRTRRIVAELNALKSVEALGAFESELRGVLCSQESRCRTTVMTAALSSECVLREHEALFSEETAQRGSLKQAYYTVTNRQFAVVHLRMQEEVTRRALRRQERSVRRDLTYRARAARLFLAETDVRDALCAHEACWREELTLRRVVEIGNEVQREIITASRLSGHLRSVAHARTVQDSRHQIELREEQDRSAVARLSELHMIMLFEGAREDFSSVIRRDVAHLSDVNREAAQQAAAELCRQRLQHCQDQETELRHLEESQEAAQYKELAHGFLLGWRNVYKAITKDPNVLSMFGKIELLVRREIADQERHAFDALRVAAQCGMSLHQRHRAERRALCQDYVTGARAVWAEEGCAANTLLRLHHVRRSELSALGADTVLSTAETAKRHGLCGMEAAARLSLNVRYHASTLQLRCVEEMRNILTEEARGFTQLRQRCAVHFQTQHLEQLAATEEGARMALERDEASAAADTLLLLRQALLLHRVSDASRPLLQVEASFRAQLEEEEKAQYSTVTQHCCRGIAKAAAAQLVVDEATTWRGVRAAEVCEAEDVARQAIAAAGLEGLAALHAPPPPPTTAEESVRQEVDGEASLPHEENWTLSECVPELWSDVWVEWELDESNGASAASYESRKTSVVPLLSAYAAQCEEVLTDAYLERDVIHFAEHAAWRSLLAQTCSSPSTIPTNWRLHSVSLKQESNQRAASVNMWDSNQHFDVSFPVTQQQEEAIVGERTITFYVPYASSASAVLPREASPGMIFFLILDDDGTVLSSATLITEMGSEDAGCLCVALNNGAGYLRFE